MEKEKATNIDFSANTNSLGISDEVCRKLNHLEVTLENYLDKECKSMRKILAKKDSIDYQTLLDGNGWVSMSNRVGEHYF